MEKSAARNQKNKKSQRSKGERVTVVGIGTSAGGVQALQKFFEAMPADLGVAFVVVLHLSPDMASDLAPILSARTRLPVTQIQKTARLEPNHVYIIPPNRRLLVMDNEISAVQFEEARGSRAPIDLFFRSLAEQHGDGVAIILTGAGSDGAMGVRAVKEAGGVIIVQDPVEAEYPSMPRSAIATGAADLVLPLSEIVERLPELIRSKESLTSRQLQHSDEDHLLRILGHLRVRTGHDFSKYKRSTIIRRIARRTQVARLETLEEYYTYLKENVEEVQALFGDLLISVTTFFRDPHSFEKLAQVVLPHLFEGKEPTDVIRVWVPGCATGEEAYSVAILLLEEAARHELRPEIQIFASDLDAGALAIAREGRYPVAIAADISEERLRRFFSAGGDHYRVKRELRDVLLFASHSLLKDPPFTRLDLISCRNLLIYLDRDLQQQVCNAFHYALNPNGFLFLGSSESADNPPGLFRPLDREARIFVSTGKRHDKPPIVPGLFASPRTPEHVHAVARASFPSASQGAFGLHRQLLEKLAPPSILIDEGHRILHLSETAGRYLQPSGGPLTSDAAELVRPELRFDLRAALHRAFQTGESTLTLPIAVHFNGAPQRVYIQVKPIQDRDSGTRHVVALFIEGEALEGEGEGGHDSESGNDVVQRLKQELQLTRTNLRAKREEFESANEELRAANEELQSINEEYRSTSEELETSKEELQSINEELQTVNNELKLKLETVSRAHSDLQNLMAATDVGTLFLDTGLCIKRFTPSLATLFNISPSDEGRPITNFTHRLEFDGLSNDARSVLQNLTPIEREIRSETGNWYLMRLRPYRTVDNKIDGVVATFVDVTERRRTQQALKDSEERLQQESRLVELSRAPLFGWNFDSDTITKWNRGSEDLYGYSRDEAIGQKKNQLLKTSVFQSSFADLKQQLSETGSWAGELKQTTKDGREVTVESQIELVSSEQTRLCLESVRDVTDRRLWEERQKLLLGELSHRVKNTLGVVLSIARQTRRSAESTGQFVESFEGRVSALADSHQLLAESDWKGAELGELVRQQLQPYLDENGSRVSTEGGAVVLPADLAAPFAMVIHELCTNALKYGSWSKPKGKVILSWHLSPGSNGEKILHFTWKESGGPPVHEPKTFGFGSALIENSLPNATVLRKFDPKGLICTIELPIAKVNAKPTCHG